MTATLTTRISALNPADTSGPVKEMLNAVQAKLGVTPNMMRTMAQSPALLEGYLAFSGALAKGALSAGTREQIALTVGQANGCEYCLSAHSVLGKFAGLKPDQITAARHGSAVDPKAQAALTLASQIVQKKGDVSDKELEAAREAGLTDAEVAEVVGHVALNVLTNYFNQLAHTEIDFPKVSLKL